jgi:hypothetical protein
MSKSPRPSVPRSLVNRPIQGNKDQGFIKASLSLERGKLPNEGLARDVMSQLVLFEEYSQTSLQRQNELVEASGLEGLSLGAERAIHAVQTLLSDRGYKNSFPNQDGIIVRLTDYLRAYGITEFKGKAAQDAQDALIHDLAKRQTLLFFKKDKNGKKAVKFEGPLVTTIKVSSIEALEPVDAVHLKDQDLGSNTLLIIKPTEIFYAGIDRLCLFKPRDFYKELERVCGSKRRPQAVDRFLTFLLTTNFTTILESTLIERLDLADAWNRRKKPMVLSQITRAIEVATEMGYLESYSKKPGLDPLYTFTTNPEKVKSRKSPANHPNIRVDP